MSNVALSTLETAISTSLAYSYNGSTIENLVNTFLNSVTEANWNAMYAGVSSAGFISFLDGIRLLITVADGSVAYDSTKSNNSWSNFRSRSINDNHNSRPEILLALLSSSGTGTSNRYSTSTLAVDLNYAYRFGLSTNFALGCYRLSQ